MSKKGILTLTVEVDYDQMITEESIPFLNGYTGKATFDELAKNHMAKLGDSIDEAIKNLPFVRYGIRGDLVPIQDEEIPEGTPLEEISTFGELVQKIEDMEEPSPVEDLPSTQELIEMLDEAVENISMTYGLPQKIMVNDLMMSALKDVVPQLNKTESTNDTVEKYNGFDVILEGMEELFIIEYKEYKTNVIETYSRKI